MAEIYFSSQLDSTSNELTITAILHDCQYVQVIVNRRK